MASIFEKETTHVGRMVVRKNQRGPMGSRAGQEEIHLNLSVPKLLLYNLFGAL